MNQKQSCQQNNLENQPHLTIQLQTNPTAILFTKMYLIMKGTDFIQTYHMITRQITTIKLNATDFSILDFPPYIFACLIGQYIYFYPEIGLIHQQEIQKVKISKMNVMSICRFNKGYFLGGYNRSPLPTGGFINKRTIYYIEKFNRQNKNKPLWQISLPKSNSPISILEYQHPYLLCYIEPQIYILTPQNKEILVSFSKKDVVQLKFIEGRYCYNYINLIGLYNQTQGSTHILTADIERNPIFGVQVSQTQQFATDLCFSKDGRIFIAVKESVFQYHPGKNKKQVFYYFGQNHMVLSIACTHKNSLIVLIRKRIEDKKQIQQGNVRIDKQQSYKTFFQIFYLA